MPLPRFILRSEYSINAKLLYALLLGRTQLSQKSGWVSEDENVYVIYTIRQMANDLNRSERTVKAALAELENAGLITRIRQGWNRANHLFLQLPDEVQLSSRPECAAEERARREAEQRELERLNRIAMLRSEAFRDSWSG